MWQLCATLYHSAQLQLQLHLALNGFVSEFMPSSDSSKPFQWQQFVRVDIVRVFCEPIPV